MMKEEIDYEVIKKSYDFTIDVDGQLCGLTAGDMGYEDTGIFVDEFCKEAINNHNEWLVINNITSPKEYTIVQLYGKIEIPNYNSESDYDEQNNVHIGYYENDGWWTIYDRNNCRSLRLKDVTHFRYLKQDKPN